MTKTWTGRLDDWLRRHPRVMLLLVLLMTVLVTIILLRQGGAQVILYEAF